ncbi:MAG: 50S ribosomal protein L4 [Chlamydiae bacterium RIFCSPHIGHO2_12_FULL_49_11]|nr:MAG: 50S ribosomal protein L4 [Chlamydiae bacterium RIFCSPHIGHO2_12_FULL_49_11]
MRFAGDVIGDAEFSYDENALANDQLIKDYIVALRANARQWSANTKTRAEVKHANFKPHAQKGTGNARQGCIVAPQYKGGGRVHAPKPKFDQHVKVNRKEKRAAVRSLFVQRGMEEDLFILDEAGIALDAPKTKEMSRFIRTLGKGNKRVLICLPEQREDKLFDNFILSTRNLKNVSVMTISNVNGYDLLVNRAIVLLDSATETFQTMMRGE